MCNSGVSLTPVIDGRALHFAHRGLYNGLSILGDQETGSHWDHVTGRCISGPLAGRTMETATVLHVTAAQVLHMYPDALTAISRPTPFRKFMGWAAEWIRTSRRGYLPPGFRATMGTPDSRLPMMEMGLGVWDGRASRFYPLRSIRKRGGAIVDSLSGAGLVIYIDPETAIPCAILDSTAFVEPGGEHVTLDRGRRLHGGLVLHSDGFSEIPRRPMQLFTRWYGFSFTFPDCEIGGK